MDRVDLARVEHTVHRWWIKGVRGEAGHAVIGLGQTAAGEWIVARAGRGWNGSWIASDERHGCETVSRWMHRKGGAQAWREVTPAE